MPEGDSIATNAMGLRTFLGGKEIVSLDGTSGSLRAKSSHLLGSSVSNVRSVGKNLVIDFSTGYSLRVHLGMNGRWRVVNATRSFEGSAQAVLTTDTHHVGCVGASIVEVDRSRAIDLEIQHLGPDLLGEKVDLEEIVRRARVFDSEPLERVLLNQRVAAGIGNVYKSELPFLEGLNPKTPVSQISDDQLRSVFTRARRLLAVNVRPGRRTTTGNRGHGAEAWVYGRAGLACRRCSVRIETDRFDGRRTYWCPSCQPDPLTEI